MSVRLSCPSCNTAFTLDAIPADRRAACPRCGDVFPIRGEVAEEANREGASGPTSPLPQNTKHQTPNTPQGRSLPRVVAFALALGLLGFAVGLAVHYSRGSKKPAAPPEPLVVAAPTPPAKLAGLGYLPAECNIVFAVQPGPVLDHANRVMKEPGELLAQFGVPPQVLAALDQVGLPLPQIDHIAGGIFAYNEGEELRAALALVLKQPLADEDDFLQKLKARPAPNKKGRYVIQLEKVPFSPMLTRVSPTVWVFGLNEKDFAATDRGGYGPGGTQFRGSDSEGVRKMLASVPPEAAVWVVADDDRDWTQKPLVKLAANQFPEVRKWLPELSSGRGGLFALTFGEQVRMRLFVRTADTAVAERVRAYFQVRAAERESATAGGGGVFALFDAPFDPALLQRFIADAK
jgi:hypothetical protein